ncbi:MAG: molybdopterin molybdotransferase MoeA [Hyphomicrobiales bacterium]|nr:molybdopterin molybdotransferase MoeA [Hyphomicrobiales bacterium]
MINDCFSHDEKRLLHFDAVDLLKSRLGSIATSSLQDLEKCGGKILAQDITAPKNIPAFDNSAMDGFAFDHQDYLKNTGVFPLGARIAAGDNKPVELAPCSAARIFTGAPMPTGADSVAMQEDCKTHQSEGQTFVIIPQGYNKGANVRLAGEDVNSGECLLSAGSRLRPQDIAAIASCGFAKIEICDPLKIALASTGNEIIRPGNCLEQADVYDANFFMLNSQLNTMPVEVTDLGILPDDRAMVESTLTRASSSYDIVITSGGASLGEEDHITSVLAQKGTRHLWQLAIKPGRPMCFGNLNDAIFFGLPGNPVASFVCFLLYIYPSLLVLGGSRWKEPTRIKIPSAIKFNNKKSGRREFWRGYLEPGADGTNRLHKYDRDGSGLISGLRHAEGFIEIGEDVTEVKPDEMLDFIPFSQFGIV